MRGLNLSRLEGESFTIGDDITVVVMEARRGKCRLKIVAPRDIPIHRDNTRVRFDSPEEEAGDGPA